jgi:hypothetical protein
MFTKEASDGLMVAAQHTSRSFLGQVPPALSHAMLHSSAPRSPTITSASITPLLTGHDACYMS